MKEIEDIIQAYLFAVSKQLQTALATVVLVEGSSYRRPGARMLVTEDGQITGTISGGCLEADAIRKALLSISQQQNKLVAYNSMDDEDFTEGVQLGCNGIVYILFEPINAEKANNPIHLLQKALLQQQNSVLITLFNSANCAGDQLGTTMLYDGDDLRAISFKEDTVEALQKSKSIIKSFTNSNGIVTTAFLELLKPMVHLIIAGAGNDALPLVTIAQLIGWRVTIADGRKTHANEKRFQSAQSILVGKPDEVMTQLSITQQTVVVLMTHNYNYDIALLKLLLNKPCPYIGILGPKKKTDKMLQELEQEGVFISAKEKEKIYGPAGLDIGAETPQEIALSIIAEIKTVLGKKPGGILRNKQGFIHDDHLADISITTVIH